MTDGTNDGKNIATEVFIEGMFNAVPELVNDIDIWASHPYPQDKSICDPIDESNANPKYCFGGHKIELDVLNRFYGGKPLPKVIITETAWYHADDSALSPQQFVEAFNHYWIKDDKVIGVTPFQFTTKDPKWVRFNWVNPDTLEPNEYYNAVKEFRKSLGTPDPELV
jgi:hypothetical protein